MSPDRIARRRWIAAVALAALPSLNRLRAQATREPGFPMRIRILIGDRTLTATLGDSAASRDFAAMLPLALVLEDHAATEKIAMLPRRLSTTGAPEGMTPQAGDICYYAPWGNIAIFHKPFRHSAGLVHLGRIDDGLEALRVEGRLPARFEAVPR